jgi:hypothetical protein
MDFEAGTHVTQTKPPAPPPYFISYTRGRRFARLHRWEGCHRRPGERIWNYEYVFELEPDGYDARCKDC